MPRIVSKIDSSVAEARRMAGFTQLQLARLAGVSRQTVVELEGGGYNPSTALALRLSVLLGRSVEELFRLPEAEVASLVARRDGSELDPEGGPDGVP